MAEKKLTNQQLLGEQGIALISLAVSGIGFVWRPTSQHDTGIDGEIELRDTMTGAVSGLLLKVQSKAVSSFANETADGFDYCKRTAMSGEADARLVFSDVVLHESCGAGRHNLSRTPVDDERSVPC